MMAHFIILCHTPLHVAIKNCSLIKDSESKQGIWDIYSYKKLKITTRSFGLLLYPFLQPAL